MKQNLIVMFRENALSSSSHIASILAQKQVQLTRFGISSFRRGVNRGSYSRIFQ